MPDFNRILQSANVISNYCASHEDCLNCGFYDEGNGICHLTSRNPLAWDLLAEPYIKVKFIVG